jgi:hypothetical protein
MSADDGSDSAGLKKDCPGSFPAEKHSKII